MSAVLPRFKRTAAFIALAVFFPTVATAQVLQGFQSIAGGLGMIVGILIAIAFAAALLFFFWGVAMYIRSSADEDAKTEGRRIMIGGVIGIFVIASIWGIVWFLRTQFGIFPAPVGTNSVPTFVVPQNPFRNLGTGATQPLPAAPPCDPNDPMNQGCAAI